MSLFVIEPRDTLILRDGRPFDDSPGRTIAMPWPSSVAGLLRARVGSKRDGKFDHPSPSELLSSVSMLGPWLAQLNDQGEATKLFFPTPLDAMWERDESVSVDSKRVRVRLECIATPEGCETDLASLLELVGIPATRPREASKSAAAPAFYSSDAMATWLTQPMEVGVVGGDEFLEPLEKERRMHSVPGELGTVTDGNLFGSEGLRFTRTETLKLSSASRFGLAAFSTAEELTSRGGLCVLGGERRISFFRPTALKLPTRPSIELDARRRLRIVLTTPVVFAEGAVPKAIRGAKVVAACVGRPEVVSGWDMVRNAPKPTRWMAPAGSVYWVQVPESIDWNAYIDSVWMKSISENEQDARDGFGVALVGVP